MQSAPIIIVQLIHIQGPFKGDIQEFSGNSIVIGREKTCQLRFPADYAVVSRRHAEIRREGNRFKLTDLSTNGSFVNGKRVKEIFLNNGDVLTLTDAEDAPKISFLTEIKEGTYQPEVQAQAPPQTFEQRPAQPVYQPPPPPPKQEWNPEPVQSAPAPQQQEAAIQRVQAPLVIQFGPTLRSYKELPITIGKNPRCDFILDQPAINDQHAQVFFSQDKYWIKDLTGQQAVKINRQPTAFQSPLELNDEISLSSQGPVFRYIGEGRLAEVEEARIVEDTPRKMARPEPSEKKPRKGLFSKLRRQ